MFFQPYRDYIATRQIYNERDFGQKYVKLWIRDADTDEALVDGAEMTESTDEVGRFKYKYRLPGDPTGSGRQLRVITVVYTNDGYTERDLNYQVEETDIIVRDMFVLGGGGGGGSDCDYEKIKKIVKEEIAKIKPCEKTDLSSIKKDIKDAKKSILSQINAIPETDITPIEVMINELAKAIASVPQPKDFDYSRLDEVKELVSKLEKSPKIERLKDLLEMKKAVRELNLTSKIEGLLYEILDKLDEQMEL